MGLTRGTYHRTAYLREELEFVDGVATVDVSDHDNATILVRSSAPVQVCATGWTVPLPASVEKSGDEFCIQVDLRGLPSIDVRVVADAEGVVYAGITGVDF